MTNVLSTVSQCDNGLDVETGMESTLVINHKKNHLNDYHVNRTTHIVTCVTNIVDRQNQNIMVKW